MNEFNNLSVLPFYSSLSEQNARKWWVFGRVYPLYCGKSLLPFQFHFIDIDLPLAPYLHKGVSLYKSDGTFVGDIGEIFDYMYENYDEDTGLYQCIYLGTTSLTSSFLNYEGQYYIKFRYDYGLGAYEFYSEVFTLVMDLSSYLKIMWWDTNDLITDDGIVYYDTALGQYKNILYLQADVAKPEYVFDDESEERDGYSFPIKQISKKKYKFSFLASEYILDVMRFIRMADYIEIIYNGNTFKPNSFLITPEWVSEGDVATVDAEFETNTVIKKIGVGYIRPAGGDFNEDYGPQGNRDFSPSSN